MSKQWLTHSRIYSYFEIQNILRVNHSNLIYRPHKTKLFNIYQTITLERENIRKNQYHLQQNENKRSFRLF